jgi:uncharacterized Zn finger protein
MQAIGNCPMCKRENTPIEVLEIGKDNQYRGRCVACGALAEGFLVTRNELHPALSAQV